jgi:hypothetical protein
MIELITKLLKQKTSCPPPQESSLLTGTPRYPISLATLPRPFWESPRTLARWIAALESSAQHTKTSTIQRHRISYEGRGQRRHTICGKQHIQHNSKNSSPPPHFSPGLPDTPSGRPPPRSLWESRGGHWRHKNIKPSPRSSPGLPATQSDWPSPRSLWESRGAFTRWIVAGSSAQNMRSTKHKA